MASFSASPDHIRLNEGACSGETAVIAFARAPIPGKVKTRLAAGIGDAKACAFYAACAGRVLSEVASCVPKQQCVYNATVVHFTSLVADTLAIGSRAVSECVDSLVRHPGPLSQR